MNDKTVFYSTTLNHYESGRKNVGIFELADLLGVTEEALRKYETREIIRPIRDERGYRKFHSWDLTKIIYARQLKQEGFSLNDIADTMKNSNAGEQVDGIERLQKKLALEIQYRQKLIHWLSAQKDEVLRSEQAGERCVTKYMRVRDGSGIVRMSHNEEANVMSSSSLSLFQLLSYLDALKKEDFHPGMDRMPVLAAET